MPGNRIDSELAKELWEEHYWKNSRGWMRVSSDSMMPLIHPGDSVLMTPVPPPDIKPGDVIIFRREDRLIIHRVVTRRSIPDGFLFTEQGDGLKSRGSFSAADVFGRALVVKHGQVYYRLDSPAGKLAARILAGWYRISSPFFAWRRRASSNRIVRFIVLPVRAVNKLLVKMCCLVWRTAGRHAVLESTQD
jgi:signal peptidase I